MPHAIIEYSANLEHEITTRKAVMAAHKVILDSGLFAPDAVKSRAHKVEDFVVGTDMSSVSFVHIWIALMEGRALEKKQALTQAMFDTISALIPEATSVSVDIRDMEAATYRK